MDNTGFCMAIIFWSFLGAIVSALIIQGKTKDQGRIFLYAILGFFLGIFGIFLALAAQTLPEKPSFDKPARLPEQVISEKSFCSKCGFRLPEQITDHPFCGNCGKILQIIKQETHGVKKCPFCAEEIKAEAIKCKHCGSMLAQ